MILDPILDVFRGKAVTIPPLDGRPANTLLDDASIRAKLSEVDNLAIRGNGAVYRDLRQVRCSPSLMVLSLGSLKPLQHRSRRLPSLRPARSPSASKTGKLLIGWPRSRGAGRHQLHSPRLPSTPRARSEPSPLSHPGIRPPPECRALDLMEKGSTGTCLETRCGGFSFPANREAPWPRGLPVSVVERGDERTLIIESWRAPTGSKPHRRRRASRCSSCDRLPGYPGTPRRRAPDGGAWLAVFAPRNRLIEFVPQEQALSSPT